MADQRFIVRMAASGGRVTWERQVHAGDAAEAETLALGETRHVWEPLEDVTAQVSMAWTAREWRAARIERTVAA